MKNDGGPAFPTLMPPAMLVKEKGGAPEVIECSQYHAPGMTLRDWFAGQALDEMIYGPASKQGVQQMQDEAERIAKLCYIVADAMLERRDK